MPVSKPTPRATTSPQRGNTLRIPESTTSSTEPQRAFRSRKLGQSSAPLDGQSRPLTPQNQNNTAPGKKSIAKQKMAGAMRNVASKTGDKKKAAALNQAADLLDDPLKVLLDRILVFAWMDGVFGLVGGAETMGITLLFAAVGFLWIHIHWIASSLGIEHFSELGYEWKAVPGEAAHIPEEIFLVFCDILFCGIAAGCVVLLYYAACQTTWTGWAACKVAGWAAS